MTCVVTINDGTNTVTMDDQVTSLDIDYATLSGGGGILRFLDGSAAKQQRWMKEGITVSGEGRVPQGIRQRDPGGEGGLDYSQNLTVTITTGLGSDVYTCVSNGPQENWRGFQGRVSWTLAMEEV